MDHVIGRMRRPRRRRSNTVRLAPAGHAGQRISRVLAQAVQAKFVLGQPGDRHEREADQVAERIVGRPRPDGELEVAPVSALDGRYAMQRMCAECEDEEESELSSAGESVQRQESEEEEEEVQLEHDPSRPAGSLRGLSTSLEAERSRGRPLPTPDKDLFEDRFGADFSQVRIHTDTRAGELARRLNARAFTVGRNVMFGAGHYAPGTPGGQRLIAHELTHVLQQRSGSKAKPRGDRIQRWSLGGAPAPFADWEVVPPEHVARVDKAEAIVRGVLADARCVNFFRDNCTDGSGAAALPNAFAGAKVYHRNADDQTLGESDTSSNIAYNTRTYRIGRFMMASTLLHEMFHTCDPVWDATDEIQAENAIETCRLHTPFISAMSPASGPVGAVVRLSGFSFGGRRGGADQVLVNGLPAAIRSWGFTGGSGNSGQEIVFEVPAGATTGDVVVVNNGVRSNARSFTVT